MTADIAVIGGTGFYKFIGASNDIAMNTPYGRPSAPISIAGIGERRVAFLPRHGRRHEHLPSEVPYAANLYALRALGVRHVIGFNTVGSLHRGVRKGDFAFCSQFVDRTYGRADSIFHGPNGAHISSADPYCPSLRAAALQIVKSLPYRFHSEATVVVIQGPRFSTRAESTWFRNMGWDVVNMTQYPEVVIARELELCYLNVSYVTDYDVAANNVVGDSDEAPVSHEGVIRVFSMNESAVARLITLLVGQLPLSDECSCRHALDGALVGAQP